MPKYNADYFIKKFKAIPRSKWCTLQFDDNLGRHCVMGHCGVGHISEATKESGNLKRIFSHMGKGYNPYTLNDLIQPRFRQTTPKGRILAALRVAKKAGY